MKSKEITSIIIKTENQILLLSERKKIYTNQLNDVKDLMRKMREQQVKFAESSYCFSNNIAIKKKPKQIYPFLQNQSKKLTSQKIEIDNKLLKQMKILIKLMKEGKLTGGQLDPRVHELIREFELTYEQELMDEKKI